MAKSSDRLLLYHWAPSRSLTARWMLEEVGRPYDIALVDISKGEQHEPRHLALNPMGKLPVLAHGDVVIATPAPAIVADLLETAGQVGQGALSDLRRIPYLANLCLVLELDRPLSSTYWLNVNDPGFPFVGVIEHTNFERPETYGGRHIVYLSRYLPEADPMYRMSDGEVQAFALPHLQRMFPEFRPDWVRRAHVWRARWAQPVVERHYSRLIPAEEGPLPGLYLASMAQIYPEDRGTNHAVREGRRIAHRVAGTLTEA